MSAELHSDRGRLLSRRDMLRLSALTMAGLLLRLARLQPRLRAAKAERLRRARKGVDRSHDLDADQYLG